MYLFYGRNNVFKNIFKEKRDVICDLIIYFIYLCKIWGKFLNYRVNCWWNLCFILCKFIWNYNVGMIICVWRELEMILFKFLK